MRFHCVVAVDAARYIGLAPVAGFGQQRGLHIGEHIGDGLPGDLAGRRFEGRLARILVPQTVAAQHRYHAVLHVSPTDFDDDRRALAHPVPALGCRLARFRIEQYAQLLAKHMLPGERGAQPLAIIDQRGILVIVAQHGQDHDLPRGEARRNAQTPQLVVWASVSLPSRFWNLIPLAAEKFVPR